MNNRTFTVAFVVAVVVVLAAIVWRWNPNAYENGLPPGNNATSTYEAPTSTGNGNGASIETTTLAGGEISLSRPSDYGLAATSSQVLVRSYIPPCVGDFDYCLYYKGDAYDGTNFEAAGLRVKQRTDLKAERLCLNTPPAGFTNVKPAATSSEDLYAASVFPTGGGAAGHVASGNEYRLFVRQSSNCYEFETSIGNSQFANYPSGTIREFTAADRQTVEASLRSILASVKLLPAGTPVIFPASRAR